MLEERNLVVDALLCKLWHKSAFQDRIHILDVHDHASVRIDIARHGYVENVIVTVIVFGPPIFEMLPILFI